MAITAESGLLGGIVDRGAKTRAMSNAAMPLSRKNCCVLVPFYLAWESIQKIRALPPFCFPK